jgi:ribosomal subunit interface protein
MQIQVNTDNTIERHEPLTTHVESVVKDILNRFSDRITRVVVHLGKSNDATSSSGDHRCLMEARIQGHSPIAASNHAANLHQAIQGAAEKLNRSIDSTLGRISDSTRGGTSVADSAPGADEEQ